ncbi:MAG: NAD-dependent epimerase/dehydratase family protein [Pseudomonadota bacterium]
MRCLVVGGTGFLGGAIADALVDDGHSVAIVSRGSTTRRTRPEIKVIVADRYGSLDHLKAQKFDWVFDTCAYAPDAVRSLLSAVGDRVARYCVISSISAYGTFAKPGLDETETVPTASDRDYAVAAGLPAEDRASALAYGPSYGPLKRACEIEARRVLGDRATALRVGLLVGVGDYTDRLTWWVRRIDGARGVFPAPAPRERPVQLIDARDAAKFAVRCAEEELSGVWNVTGKAQTFAGVLAAIVAATGSNAEPVWVSEEAILDADITPWIDVPMMTSVRPSFRHLMEVSTDKAQAAGLECRPLRQTLIPLIEWDRSRRSVPLKGGMSADQEARLLDR